MDGSDLTAEQVAKLREKLEPPLRYLAKLTSRMQKRGFQPDDALFARARAAEAAVLALVTELRALHGEACLARLGDKRNLVQCRQF